MNYYMSESQAVARAPGTAQPPMTESLIRSNQLSLSRQEQLAQITDELKHRLQEAAHNLIESGRLLIQAKRLVGHGHFRDWLHLNFSMSAKTANRFMSVSQLVERFQLDEQMMGRLLTLDLKTLYELAAKSTAAGVQQEMLQQLSQGRDVSYELIRLCKRDMSTEPATSESELTRLTQRVNQFASWLENHQPELEQPLPVLDPQTRHLLAHCAERLQSAQDRIEAILYQVEGQVIQVEPQAQSALTVAAYSADPA